MQALQDAVIVGHVALATIQDSIVFVDDEQYETDPENIQERPREFQALTRQECPLLVRAREVLRRFIPPPPPFWLQLLLVGWSMYCWSLGNLVFLLIGPEKSKAAHDELMMLTG